MKARNLKGLNRLAAATSQVEKETLGVSVGVATVQTADTTTPGGVSILRPGETQPTQVLTWWVQPVVGKQVWVIRTKKRTIIAGYHNPDRDIVSTTHGSVSGSGPITGGGYEQKANGRLTCWIRFRITPVANTNTSRTWTFPVPFIAIPAVTATADTSATTVQGAYVTSPSLTDVQGAIVRSNTTDTYIQMVAEGFWK